MKTQTFVSDRLKSLRVFTGCSIEEMAALAGTTKSEYLSWEKRKSLPSIHQLKTIVSETKCNELWLINGLHTEPMFPRLNPNTDILKKRILAKKESLQPEDICIQTQAEHLRSTAAITIERLTSTLESLKEENRYLWAKIAELEQIRIQFLILLTEPKTNACSCKSKSIKSDCGHRSL